MKRHDLEHIIRASTAILGVDAVVVVGSQSILGKYPHPPPELAISMEADVFVPDNDDNEGVLDGSIGELSMFHQTFGYYVDEVSETTSVLPEGWKNRLIPIQNKNTDGKIGLCLDPHDLAIAKYVAGRPKDREYTAALIRHGLINQRDVLARLGMTYVDGIVKRDLEQIIYGQFDKVKLEAIPRKRRRTEDR